MLCPFRTRSVRLAPEADLQQICANIPESAASVEYWKCDLTDAESLASAAEQIRVRWGNPTVLCCIAGIVRGKPLLGQSYLLGHVLMID